MAALYSYKSVALLIAPGRGLEIETYPSKLKMILDLIGNASIAGGAEYFGSPGHLAALDEIENRLASVRKQIIEEN